MAPKGGGWTAEKDQQLLLGIMKHSDIKLNAELLAKLNAELGTTGTAISQHLAKMKKKTPGTTNSGRTTPTPSPAKKGGAQKKIADQSAPTPSPAKQGGVKKEATEADDDSDVPTPKKRKLAQGTRKRKLEELSMDSDYDDEFVKEEPQSENDEVVL